jgi:hypothetical protein
MVRGLERMRDTLHPRPRWCHWHFGLLQDGDVNIGVFPEREEIFLSGEKSVEGTLCTFAQY